MSALTDLIQAEVNSVVTKRTQGLTTGLIAFIREQVEQGINAQAAAIIRVEVQNEVKNAIQNALPLRRTKRHAQKTLLRVNPNYAGLIGGLMEGREWTQIDETFKQVRDLLKDTERTRKSVTSDLRYLMPENRGVSSCLTKLLDAGALLGRRPDVSAVPPLPHAVGVTPITDKAA